MRFLEPSYLLLLPIALLGVWWSGRRLLGMSRGRKRFALALRMVVFALLILALAAPQAVRPNRGTCTIFVLDASDSISDAGRQAAKRYLQEAIKTRGADDLVGLVVFGRDAVVDFLPAGARLLGDKAYNSAADAASILAETGVRPVPARRATMRPHAWLMDAIELREYRHTIETVNSQLEKMGAAHLTAGANAGFELKAPLSALIALICTNVN